MTESSSTVTFVSEDGSKRTFNLVVSPSPNNGLMCSGGGGDELVKTIHDLTRSVMLTLTKSKRRPDWFCLDLQLVSEDGRNVFRILRNSIIYSEVSFSVIMTAVDEKEALTLETFSSTQMVINWDDYSCTGSVQINPEYCFDTPTATQWKVKLNIHVPDEVPGKKLSCLPSDLETGKHAKPEMTPEHNSASSDLDLRQKIESLQCRVKELEKERTKSCEWIDALERENRILRRTVSELRTQMTNKTDYPATATLKKADEIETCFAKSVSELLPSMIKQEDEGDSIAGPVSLASGSSSSTLEMGPIEVQAKGSSFNEPKIKVKGRDPRNYSINFMQQSAKEDDAVACPMEATVMSMTVCGSEVISSEEEMEHLKLMNHELIVEKSKLEKKLLDLISQNDRKLKMAVDQARYEENQKWDETREKLNSEIQELKKRNNKLCEEIEHLKCVFHQQKTHLFNHISSLEKKQGKLNVLSGECEL